MELIMENREVRPIFVLGDNEPTRATYGQQLARRIQEQMRAVGVKEPNKYPKKYPREFVPGYWYKRYIHGDVYPVRFIECAEWDSGYFYENGARKDSRIKLDYDTVREVCPDPSRFRRITVVIHSFYKMLASIRIEDSPNDDKNRNKV